ncbi:Uncharacterised protein [Yersinia enterocolitica]|nr:Uncharacterised protein [Yersinia enterocolitica]
MVSRNTAGADAAGRFSDIDGGFEIMALRQQFLDRINYADFITFRLEQCFHNSNGQFLAATDDGGINTIGALTEQRNTVQDVFELRKLMGHQRF